MTANTAWYRSSVTLMYLMGATVTNQPKPLGQLSRRCATHQPKRFSDASAELSHPFGARSGIRTLDLGIKSPLLYQLS